MTNDLSAILARAGSNDVPYVDACFPDRPLILRIARPRHCDAATPVLFVHHGVNRNGYDYRDFWLPLVDVAGVLVIAPEFSKRLTRRCVPAVRTKCGFGSRRDPGERKPGSRRQARS